MQVVEQELYIMQVQELQVAQTQVQVGMEEVLLLLMQVQVVQVS